MTPPHDSSVSQPPPLPRGAFNASKLRSLVSIWRYRPRYHTSAYPSQLQSHGRAAGKRLVQHVAYPDYSLRLETMCISGSFPVNYGVIVYPAFQALDVFGPLDALNVLSTKFPMNLSIIAKTLDPVPTRPPSKRNPFKSNFSQSIVPTHTFSSPPENLDVLLVPGGMGVGKDTEADPSDLQEIFKYIDDTYPSLQYLITVCTGAILAARAGVLDGKNATTDKESWEWEIAQGPKVNWKSHARWVVDGNIYTTSGVSAGIDGKFSFIKDRMQRRVLPMG